MNNIPRNDAPAVSAAGSAGQSPSNQDVMIIPVDNDDAKPGLSFGWPMKTGVAQGVLAPGAGLTAWTTKAVVDALTKLPGGRDTWFSPHVWNDNQRNKNAWRNASAVGIDLDWNDADGEHAELPPDARANFLASCREGRLPVNLAYVTPRGARLIFLLKHPITEAAEYDRAFMGAASLAMDALAQDGLPVAGVGVAGFTLDSAHDLARIYRAPHCTVPDESEPRRAEVIAICDDLYDSVTFASLAPAPTPTSSDSISLAQDVGVREAALPPPPFDALPGNLCDYGKAVAKETEADEPMVFVTMLATASAAVSADMRISWRHGWKEIAPLWIAVVAPPGGKKSPTLSKVIEPVDEYDRVTLDRAYHSALAEWEDAMAKFDEAKQNRKKGKAPAYGEEAIKPPKEPKRPQAIVQDVTIEALADVLAINEPYGLGTLLFADELKGLFDSMGCYKTKNSPDRKHYMTIYSGNSMRVNRRNRKGLLIVNHPRLSIIGGIQPAVARALHDDDEGDGMLDRFSFIGAQTLDPIADVPFVPEALRNEWRDRLLAMLPPVTAEIISMEDGPTQPERVVGFSPDARVVFAGWYETIIPAKAPPLLQGYVAKLPGLCLRIILTLHCLEHGKGACDLPVSERTIRNGIRIVEWLAAHTTRQRSLMAGAQAYGLSDDARAVLRALKKSDGKLSVRDLQTRKLADSADAVRDACRELEAAGKGRLVSERHRSGQTSEFFYLNTNT